MSEQHHRDMDDEEWDDGEEEEEEEEEEESAQLRCLVCPAVSPNLRHCLQHMQQTHGFDLPEQIHQLGINDDYELIRLINFMRREGGAAVLQRLAERAWSRDDAYLMPVDPDDAFLTVDLDELLDLRTSGGGGDRNAAAAASTEERLRVAEAALEESRREVDAMRRCVRRIVLDDNGAGPTARIPNGPVTAASGDESDDDEMPPALMDASPAAPPAPVLVFPRTAAGSGPVLGDAYFESYDRPSIHEEMLLDSVRTESYRDFIRGNAERLFAGRRVLDLGCGTGILSMVAAKAGARRVLAVDRSDIIFTAMDIARENSLHEVIEFHHGRIEDIYHQLGQVDVIISEWMGYFLLFESMLDSVLFCRERLSPSVGIFPRFYSLRVVGLNDPAIAKEKVQCWDDFYGFRMSALKRQILAEAAVRTVPASSVVTNSCEVCAIDLLTCGLDWQLVNSQISLEVSSSTATQISAVAGYFDVDFEAGERCDQQMHFSTGPESTPTHWKQTIFVLREPLPVTGGETLRGRISVRRSQTDMRSLTVELSLSNGAGATVDQRYTMD